jgi:hypothetical protein
MRLHWLIGVCVLVAAGSPASSDDFQQKLTAALHQSWGYRMKYFNPESSLRSVYELDDIDKEFYVDVTKRCEFGCDDGTRILEDRLMAAKPSDKPCYGPPYAKLQFLGRKGVVLEMTFDHSGYCIVFEGHSYIMPSDLIWELNKTAVSAW